MSEILYIMDDHQMLMNISFSLAAATCILIKMLLAKNKSRKMKRNPRSCWVKEIIRKRRDEGVDVILIPKLVSDAPHYRNFFRMSKESFGYILNSISSDLQRKDTVLRKSIPPSERLSVALRFMATG